MKKKLNFLISIVLVLAIVVCAGVIPASSFQNDEITSSQYMLLINLDTLTHVYSLKPDKPWYASYQSELMTFLLMTENIDAPEDVAITVDKDFIDALEYSDGCLKNYLGEELTLKDIAAIMLLTSGSDAAYIIADYISDGDIDAFVTMMNERAADFKCKRTNFVSPGYSDSEDHLITCSDLCRIYSRLIKNDLYKEIMSSSYYIPEKYGDDDDYAVNTENSIMNSRSPYYFRYVTGGKFATDSTSGASIIVTTEYRDMHYMFVALRGKNKAEENVFTDARRMTTWAYLNLSDRKVIDTRSSVDTATAVSVWGDYTISLYADNSARKTLPNEYEQIKFEVKLDVPDKLDLPLFRGESVGSAEVLYDREKIDRISIITNQDEGVSMLYDLGRYTGYALAKIFPRQPGKYVDAKDSEHATEATKKTKKTSEKSTDKTAEKAVKATDTTEAEE